MKASTRTLLASAGVLSLTTVHHLYGAAVYDTPWRKHAALVAAPVALVLVVAHEIYRRQPWTRLGRTSLFLFAALTLAVPVVLIGIVEGAYNHLVKNVLFFGGVPAQTFDRLFPDSLYEMPEDVFFESTGVLQFFLGLSAARWLARLWRERPREGRIGADEAPQAA